MAQSLHQRMVADAVERTPRSTRHAPGCSASTLNKPPPGVRLSKCDAADEVYEVRRSLKSALRSDEALTFRLEGDYR